MRALWEQLNEQKWLKVKEQDREYVLDAFQDLTMDDATQGSAEDEFYEAEGAEAGEGEETETGEGEDDDGGNRSEEYDTDEDDDDTHVRGVDDDGNVNSQLAVGFKHDRSFVVRGNNIGVFKHVGDKNLEFTTTITGVKTPGGKKFAPTKVCFSAGHYRRPA